MLAKVVEPGDLSLVYTEVLFFLHPRMAKRAAQLAVINIRSRDDNLAGLPGQCNAFISGALVSPEDNGLTIDIDGKVDLRQTIVFSSILLGVID